MKQEYLQIGHFPALLWGEPCGKLIIAVHGNMSHKSDTVIAMLAECEHVFHTPEQLDCYTKWLENAASNS